MRLLRDGRIKPIRKLDDSVRVPEKSRVMNIEKANGRTLVTLALLQSGTTVQVNLKTVIDLQKGQILEGGETIGTETKVVLYSVTEEVNSSIPSEVNP